MSHFIDEIRAAVARGRVALPVAAGPIGADVKSLAGVSSMPSPSLVAVETTLEADFAALVAAPAALRRRFAEAAARVRAGQDEVERVLVAVEDEVAARVTAARHLAETLKGAAVQVEHRAEAAIAAVEEPTLLADETVKAVQTSLAQLPKPAVVDAQSAAG